MPHLRSRVLGSLLGLGLLLSGVAAAESKAPAITVQMTDSAYNLMLSEDAVTSPNIQLHRSTTELRGRAFGAVANLLLTEDAVSGAVGGNPVNLKVHKEGDTLIAEGGFMNSPLKLRFNAKELVVDINRSHYPLTFSSGRYVDMRSQKDHVAPFVQLTVPSELQQRAPSEQVALLVLALAAPHRM